MTSIIKNNKKQELLNALSDSQKDNLNLLVKKEYKKQLNDWIKNFAKKNYYDYMIVEKNNKLSWIYQNSIKDIPEEIKNILKKDIAGESYIKNLNDDKLNNFKDKTELFKDLNMFIKNYNLTKDKLIKKIIELNFMKNIFSKIDEILDKKETIQILIIGKAGLGKTTLVNVVSGKFDNKIESEDNIISSHGRGTHKILQQKIMIGTNLTSVWTDAIGLGDPEEGYKTKDVFNKIDDHLKKNNKSGFDTINYAIDLSADRLDETDCNILKDFIKKFKKFYPKNLDYWKKIIILCLKTNKVKYSGKLPKYGLNDYVDSSGKYFDDIEGKANRKKFKTEYNKIYLNKLKDELPKHKNFINDRIRLRIYEGNESFFHYFRKFGKEVYSTENKVTKKVTYMLDDKYFDNLLKEMNVVIIGEASRKEGVNEKTDYRDCSILPIPDFEYLDTSLTNDKMIKKDLDKLLDENIISKNWFNNYINKLHMCSNSEKYRLTVIKLEAKNKKFKLTKESIRKTNDYVYNNIVIDIVIITGTVIKKTYDAIKNIFIWWLRK